MSYFDGFVVPVREENKDAYRAMACGALPLFQEFGSARLVEAWEDEVPDGQRTDFRRAVDAQPGEKIVFSWIEYPSRAVRDAANARMMSDPRMKMDDPMPFDGKRMIYGGFAIVTDEGGGERPGYVNGSVTPVPAANKDAYIATNVQYWAVFREHGATRMVEGWEDDVPDGKQTDFRRAVAIEEGEKVAFSWIEWPSKAVCDAGWEKIMADPRMHAIEGSFDGRRMIFGGFVPIVDG